MSNENDNDEIIGLSVYDQEPTNFERKRNEDVRYLTKRTELHQKKTEIMPDINKALLLKKGAENLLQANDRPRKFSKSHKNKITDALDTESAKLVTLKDKMDYLNSNFSTYQNLKSRLPVIPIDLKDTDPIDFKKALSPFIISHYHEDPNKYADALDQLIVYRSKVAEPQRSKSSLKDYKNYYNLLNTIEKRFFDESVYLGFRFSWSDVFTGERHIQRSPAFEKGSLIFNYAALCSQIAASCDNDSTDALIDRTRWFVQTRANLQVLQESFAHAPSSDMNSELLGFLIRVMQVQAQEAHFTRQMLECQKENEVTQLANYLGGGSFLSENYGKLASPMASGFGGEEWNQVKKVIPPSWLSLLEVKSHYYQAQINYKLAVTLLCLATQGRTPGAGPIEVGPLPTEGFLSDDGFLDAEIGLHLDKLFTALKPFIELRRPPHRTSRKGSRHHRRRRGPGMDGSTTGNGENPRSHSRIRRTLSSLSFGGLGRSKSHGLDESSSLNGRFSSLSIRSRDSSMSTTSMPNLTNGEGGEEKETMNPPSTRKDAHFLGQVCLTEALSWAKLALQAIEQSPDLTREADFKDFICKDYQMWAEQFDRVMKNNNRSKDSTSAPKAKPRSRWMPKSRPFSRSSSAAENKSGTASVISAKSPTFAAAEIEENRWAAPAFRPMEIELPKEKHYDILKSGRNMLEEDKDPFRMLGPIKFFNARKCWSEAYTVQLVRDTKVVYGFSIQGTGPVEILGVDTDTPASDNGMRTGDLVISINGMDSRFMTHNEAVTAIRFGAEGYDQAIQAQAKANSAQEGGDDTECANGKYESLVSFPQEVDVVQLTLIRPIPLAQPPVARRSSSYLVSGETPAIASNASKQENPRKQSRHRFLHGHFRS